ncbi:MAG: RNA polymerase factor sigma-70 [Candidatus Accumulibacter sp.]|uniref:RNA polymerase factor sigma-70 n=1 Tax=Accumulibacter sp. TaxID=2053492 RepID=UPI001D5992F1|nr:RNA polymerase factor sigma-70 [Accumulibacter sp.]MCB1941889.1 RNA polymerase factor sigma-70 [Accumulibacter sp.]MCP5247409.1 RNA polymerase factor sigma-70 [Accumulibacter sp.]
MSSPETAASAAGKPAVDDSSLLSDTAFLASLRQQMLKFATLQLSDAKLAEDAVQEALIGALRNAASFGLRAALKTWVFAILKNKIADILRHKRRSIDASSLLREDDEDGDDGDFSAPFDRKVFWRADERPAAWPHPEQALRQGEFWRVFEACLENLPATQTRVFMMREFVELDSQEICQTVGVSVSNLHVLLHRARLRLREYLENRLFMVADQPC